MQRREDIKGLRIAYVSDIAGIGVEAEIDDDLPRRGGRLRDAGAHVEEIAFDAPTAALLIRPGAASGWSGSNTSGSTQIEEFGANLKGNVKAGLKLTALDFAAAEQQARSRCSSASASCSSATMCCSRRRRR